MPKSLNSVQLIGNLTRDPELRYTPSGVAVCTLGIATNRNWTLDSGEKKEEVEYHRVIAWNKLAEICGQFLSKGSKVYVHGRLATKLWTAKDGTQKSTTEIIIDDMIILSSKKDQVGDNTATQKSEPIASSPATIDEKKAENTETKPAEVAPLTDDVAPDDIPF